MKCILLIILNSALAFSKCEAPHALGTVDLGNFVPLFNLSMCSMSSVYPKRQKNTSGMERRLLRVFMVVFDFVKTCFYFIFFQQLSGTKLPAQKTLCHFNK